jgi:hypothetical protein
MIKVIVVILTVATVAPAAVKRDEYGGAHGSSSGSGTTNTNSQPVYSPSASSGSYSNGGSSAYNSNGYSSRDNYPASAPSSNQYPADHSTSASSSSASYQSQPSSQGNLYYYYYPVQEKPKDSAYHTSSSNQYNSAVSPNFGNGVATGQASSDSSQHSSLEPAASGQDLSYSAQDLSYSAQNLGQGIAQEYNSQNGASYDQQLSNLASQLQQYGFGSGSGNNGFNSATFGSGSQGSYPSSSYESTGSGYSAASNPSASYGSQSGDSSAHYPSSHPSYSAAAAASSFGSQSGSQLPYSSQGSGYSPYSGQHTAYGNYASASGPQASYEAPSSGYRRYGLSSILMPMLALAGLSLLIPTVTSLGSSGRKKRSIEDNAKESAMTGYVDRLERYYSIYRTAVEKEDCMNRIICELGDAMSGVRGKNTVLTVIEKIVPTWMVNKIGVFKHAALSAEYGKCKKYMC